MYCYKILVKAYPNFVTLRLGERGIYFNRQKQPPEVLYKKRFLNCFAEFTGK